MTRPINRRGFVRGAVAGSATLFGSSLAALSSWSGLTGSAAALLRPGRTGGLGELVQSADCPELWIPPGFRVIALSRSRSPSRANASWIVPNGMDGMAAFALPNGNVRLIRNHELTNSAARAVPLGAQPYDALASGGTTSLELAIRGRDLDIAIDVVAEFASLSGTHVNCAGGRTPWGSWLSCEETTNGTTHGYGQPHGYVFEVPITATAPIQAVPLRSLGRMVHEAVAVDPRTGIVYETEDVSYLPENTPPAPGSGFYRFIPNQPRVLTAGRLQVLAVRDQPGYHTITGQRVGTSLPVNWLDIDDPDPAAAERDPSALFRSAFERGAARFHRLEGCFWADDSCYFVSTHGGDAGSGQVWRYLSGDDGGRLVLVFESPGRDVLDSPDNICTAPGGALVICEDGVQDQFIRVLRSDRMLLDLVHQPLVAGAPDPSEFAGCCFSPDNRVLFFNVQGSRTSYSQRAGATYAMWGPWQQFIGSNA